MVLPLVKPFWQNFCIILFTFSGKNEKEFEFFGVIFGYYFNNIGKKVLNNTILGTLFITDTQLREA